MQGTDSLEVTMEKQRRTAYRVDVTFLKDHHYWHNYMINQSEARKADKERRSKYSSSRARNKDYTPSTPLKSNGAKIKKRSFADEYDSDGGRRQPRTRAKRSKRPEEDDGDNDDDCFIIEQPSPPRRKAPAKPSRRGRFSLLDGDSPIAAKACRRRRPSTPEQSPIARKSGRRTVRSRIIVSSDSDTDDEPEIVMKASTTRPKALPQPSKARFSEYAHPPS